MNRPVDKPKLLAWLLLVLAACGCGVAELPATPQVSHQQPAPVAHVPSLARHSQNRLPADLGVQPRLAVRNGRPVALLPPSRGKDLRQARKPLKLLQDKPSGVLVLYDTSSSYGWLGELYAICARTLASHFGAVATKPVTQYVAGDLNAYEGVIYVGSSFGEPIPVEFLDDVLADTVPVLWICDNIWQLVDRAKDFQAIYGYSVTWFDLSPIETVVYKDVSLSRDASNGAGLVEVGTVDPALATTLASAVRKDGTTLPWAVRSLQLTYIAENPFAYIGPDDRYLAFCDLLFDAFAPQTPVRHRALLRLEDVNPTEDPLEFRAMVDYLWSEKVPFSVALIPLYVDGLGALNNGVPQTIHWTDRPAMQSAIKYATLRGGALVQHGYTHQLGDLKNPYSGVTADDFEFFLTHIDAQDNVVYDGPVPGDSAAMAIARIQAGQAEIKAAGFAAATMFEYPHYAGSSTDSKAIQTVIGKAYQAGLFFGGDLGLTPPDPAHSVSLFYPFAVTDVYGWQVTPENLGNYEPAEYNNHPPRLAKDLILSAQNNLVIRDGVASFFFHPYYPLAELKAVVAGIKAAGYTFVSAQAL